MNRKLTPYETNLLIKYGFDPVKIAAKIDRNIPIEYVTKIGEFFENEFYLTKNTLIPRVETEFLIEIGLKFVCDSKLRSVKFCDVGTGSGAIGLSFAIELQKRNISYQGILSDISDGALKVAKKNLEEYCKIYGTKLPIRTVKSDLFRFYPKEKFDIIFANLPYIPTARIPNLPISVREFEPISALDGGNDGLEQIRKLLNSADKYLEKKGIIIMEVDDIHNKKTASEFSDNWFIEVKIDYNGRNRFWLARKK